MRTKELWLVDENNATVKSDLSVAPRGLKTYSERRNELRNYNLEASAGEIKSASVIKAALWAEKLGRCLENCRS